jgi:putative phage-type endonuclease
MNQKVFNLLKQEQYQQRSQEWFKARRGCITASSAAALLKRDHPTCDNYIKLYDLEDTFAVDGKCCNPYSSETQFIIDKCVSSSFKGSMATQHGVCYEPIINDLYSKATSKTLLEFGLLKHKNLEWLGASPDAITEDGIMVEIKAPYRRRITGIPPFYYYIQVQLQLEVADLDYCDFVEYEFTEFLTEEEFLDDLTLDTKPINKGVFIRVEYQDDPTIPCNPLNVDYVYPPKEYLDSEPDLIKWKNMQLLNLPKLTDKKYNPEKFNFIPVYWKATNSSTLRIKRDQEWFYNVRPILEKQWERILYYRVNDNYKKLLSNKKSYINGETVKIPYECLLSDSSDESD